MKISSHLPLDDFPFSLWCSLKSFLSWWDLDLCFELAPNGWRVFVCISSTFLRKDQKDKKEREKSLWVVPALECENFTVLMFHSLNAHKHQPRHRLLPYLELLKQLEGTRQIETQHDNRFKSKPADIKDFPFNENKAKRFWFSSNATHNNNNQRKVWMKFIHRQI